ncbi:hypothetical protein KM155_18385 [Burkholderia pseudomallei]|nr:hypothetical protein [Burkholderia pseudomallei]QWJ98552.1 hypothetical protein KM155_18385 [Burkholderia pseudomallei]
MKKFVENCSAFNRRQARSEKYLMNGRLRQAGVDVRIPARPFVAPRDARIGRRASPDAAPRASRIPFPSLCAST